MKPIETISHAILWRSMHTGRSAVMFGRSREKLRDDIPDRTFVACILHQLHQVLACPDDIVHDLFIEPDVHREGREAKLVFFVARGSDEIFLFRHHCAEDLDAEISRFLTEPAFDLAGYSEGTKRP